MVIFTLRIIFFGMLRKCYKITVPHSNFYLEFSYSLWRTFFSVYIQIFLLGSQCYCKKYQLILSFKVMGNSCQFSVYFLKDICICVPNFRSKSFPVPEIKNSKYVQKNSFRLSVLFHEISIHSIAQSHWRCF